MLKQTKITKTKKASEIKRDWYLFDGADKVLGRLASQIAQILQGKHKVDYVPYLDSGDYVVVVNAKNIGVTGKKETQKFYQRYSGYPGGLKQVRFDQLADKSPERALRHAVSLMLPKNKLRDRRLKRLYIYPDANHPFQNQVKFIKNY
jgi:large subunit ribosomal protein L13